MERNEIERVVHAMVAEVSDLVRVKAPKLNFVNPSVGFFDNENTAGRAMHWKNAVEFNVTLARDNMEVFLDVVKHEIAHILTHKLFPNAKQAHGPEFKKVCRFLDCSMMTGSHAFNDENLKVRRQKTHAYTCPCGHDHQVSTVRHNRIVAGKATYRCAMCQKRLFAVENA